MIDADNIDAYSDPTPSVESIDGPWLTLFCADELPSIGHVVSIDDHAHAIVFRHLGQRRAHAWLPPTTAPSSITQGAPITPLNRPASVALPTTDSTLDLSDFSIAPTDTDDRLPLWPDAPPWSDLQSRRPALPIGLDALDHLAPFATDGVHLIIDLSPDHLAFQALTHRLHNALQPTSDLAILRDSDFQLPSAPTRRWHLPIDSPNTHIPALQLAIALSPRLRQSPPALAVIDLPLIDTDPTDPSAEPDPLQQGIPQIIDRLTRHLVATDDGSLTTILRLQLPPDQPGLNTIIDTLRLGDVDATITIDPQGRFNPRRSTSRAELSSPATKDQRRRLRLLHQAQQLEDKADLLGDHELSDHDRQRLADARAQFIPLK